MSCNGKFATFRFRKVAPTRRRERQVPYLVILVSHIFEFFFFFFFFFCSRLHNITAPMQVLALLMSRMLSGIIIAILRMDYQSFPVMPMRCFSFFPLSFFPSVHMCIYVWFLLVFSSFSGLKPSRVSSYLTAKDDQPTVRGTSQP